MTLDLTAALIALVAMFVIATVLNINVGLLAFCAAFVVGVWISGLDSADLLAAFPTDIFILLVGVTYLFGIARANETINWLANSAFRLAGGRVALLPWIFFLLAATITAFGGLPASTIAIVAPLAMACAAQYRINQFLMGLLVIHGTQAGSIAPISPIGIIVNGTVARAGLPDISTTVFLNQAIFVTVLCVIAFFIFGGRGLIRRGVEVPEPLRDPDEVPTGDGGTGGGPAGGTGGTGVAVRTAEPATDTLRLDAYRIATLAGIAVFAVLALGFKFNVGLTAFVIAAVLTMMRPSICDQALKLTAWPIVLLICGILTFVGVMDKIGAIDALSDAVGNLNSPMLAALAVAFIGAITSLFSTTAGVIGATVPLIVPSLAGAAAHQVAGTISAITISSSVVDTSPVSGNGALVLANVREAGRRKFFKQLMGWGMLMMVISPVLSWLIFVVVGVP